jgi:hypothetical protein
VYPATDHVDEAPARRGRLSVGFALSVRVTVMFVAGLGFGARRQRLLICFAGALSLAAPGFVASAAARSGAAVAHAAARPHHQRRSCYGLLAVRDIPGAVSAGAAFPGPRHNDYTSLCAFSYSGTTPAGGADELTTYPSVAKARAAFARLQAQLEKVAQLQTFTNTVGTPPYQATSATTATSNYFLAGWVPADESSYDVLTTTLVSTDPLGNVTTLSSHSTSGFIRVKNQIFSVTLQNSLNPEISTYPSQVHPLIVKVAREL